jgi:5'-3' exonuclease
LPEWLLVDGSSLIFRAFYGVPQTTRAPDGTLTNAIRGFLDNLALRITERKPKRVAIATDEDWRPDWRVDLIPEYKSHRTAEPVPPLLIPQMPVIMEALAATGLDAVGLEDYEAEDLIASMVSRVDPPVEIVSGDRDLFSLIRDPDVLVLYPEKGGMSVITEAEVEKRYGIPGRAYADFAVLRGDPSDGLPGISGIGPKKAADLVKRYGSVQGMLDADIFRDSDAAYLEKAVRVIAPVRDLMFPMPKGRRAKWPDDPAAVEKLSKRYGIASSFERLLRALNSMPKS